MYIIKSQTSRYTLVALNYTITDRKHNVLRCQIGNIWSTMKVKCTLPFDDITHERDMALG